MKHLYTIALRLALPFILLRLWWRGRREPGYRQGIAERFGRYSVARGTKLIWIHAVSVGEARAAAPLSYLPYDLPSAVRGFLRHFRPRLGVLMETEAWPNLLAGCAENEVP